MAIHYIFVRNPYTVIALDATRSINFSDKGKSSDFPISTGESVQDNYVNMPVTVAFEGVISSTKSFTSSDNLSPDDYIRLLREVKASRIPFDIRWHPLDDSLTNCMFTTLDFKQSKDNGFNPETGDNSLSVSFSVKQVRFAQSVETTVEVSPEVSDEVSAESTGKGGAADVPPTQNALDRNIEDRQSTLKLLLSMGV